MILCDLFLIFFESIYFQCSFELPRHVALDFPWNQNGHNITEENKYKTKLHYDKYGQTFFLQLTHDT